MWLVEELVVMLVAASKSCHKEQQVPGTHLEKKREPVKVRYVRCERVRVRTKGFSEAGVQC